MLPRINAGLSQIAIAGAGPLAQALGKALQDRRHRDCVQLAAEI
jgi:hypothetical protein